MIRIGQAGIPLSCKGRTNKDGIIYTHTVLDLNAIEIQFVRGLYVMPEEEATIIKEYSKENDIEIHVHAPYYINLAGNSEENDDQRAILAEALQQLPQHLREVVFLRFYDNMSYRSTQKI